MGMETIYHEGAGALSRVMKVKNDDDSCDRLHRVYTCVTLLVFAMILSTSNYVGSPITCWDQPYDKMRTEYIDTVCWISNTYWLPLTDDIPRQYEKRIRNELNYYQWVPFVLLLQSLMFFLPCFLWRSANTSSGINISEIVTCAVNTDSFDTKVKKTLYLFHVFLQLYLINKFLDTQHYMYGIDLALDLVHGRDWKDTGRFPRITMCDFEIRILGNLHRFTVQCVLPINLFNEKVYIFLWFWLLLLGILTSMNFAKWLRRMAIKGYRLDFIKKCLILGDNDRQRERSIVAYEKLERFTEMDLRVDGVFVIHLIATNTSELTASEVVWEMYRDLYETPTCNGANRPTVETFNNFGFITEQDAYKTPTSSDNSTGV